MVLKWAAKVLQSLSAKGIAQRLDKRRLQHELDTHRLFLLTSYHRQQGAAAGDDIAEQLAAEAQALKFEGMREAVSANLHSQLLSLSSALHAILQQQRDPMPAAARLCELAAERQREADAEAAAQRQREEARVRPGGRGLAFAFGSGAAAEQQAAASEQGTPADPSSSSGSGGSGDEGLRAGASGVGAAAGPALSVAELAAAFREQAGFCLRVAPSSIQHAESGNGLWIEGGAGVGQVVALYPGMAYNPLQYRSIPNYPKIDRDNSYIIGRFDGVVLDAKPWGVGQQVLLESGGSATAAAGAAWPAVPRSEAERNLALVEGRHPLALAHFANHPPPGVAPNVMVAAFDLRAPADAPHLRAYLPNALLPSPAEDDDPQQVQRAQQEWGVGPADLVTGLALVATRELGDEELFLNYRLSPHVPRPDWYTPVDAEEERRRWA